MFELTGSVALVTGGSRGLGRAIALAFARQGADVAVNYRGNAEAAEAVVAELSALGRRSVAIQGDTSQGREACETIVKAAIDALGGIDILVNNAATYARRPWTEITPEEWDQTLGTNLKGYFLCARAAMPYLAAGGNGRIINVSSVTFFGGIAMLLDYVASKGGIVGFTRALAREIGPEGVTVNTISPGAFPTDAEKIHPDPEGYNQKVLDSQSIKRRGTPDDIGNLVVFLAGDTAAFITGQMIAIDGGWVMH